MTGTLSGALEARKIPTSPDKLQAEAQGTIDAPEGVMKITHIQIHFQLEIPKDKRSEAERALSVFERNCPVAQTLKGSVQIDYDWEIKELD
ncbi:OsmC family protein [Halobacillus shinanisalinarum]|uniref:OsmC family protein n=1 Tax=Halobacillus shinanisalinarum TaxID=2932258 RepID=A0ABY4GW31_9BACI|nr:OsmC family protein [Halobacillus shinanisalinarum]UOQ92174.1 OsmC family protein [Halobacillus shinanisalinarum]